MNPNSTPKWTLYCIGTALVLHGYCTRTVLDHIGTLFRYDYVIALVWHLHRTDVVLVLQASFTGIVLALHWYSMHTTLARHWDYAGTALVLHYW